MSASAAPRSRLGIVSSAVMPWVVYPVFGILILLNFYYIKRFAVDIPYFDEWDFFYLLPDGFNLTDLFVPNNEHYIVLTRLQTWLLYYINGWNLVVHQLVNFAIYCVGLCWLSFFLRGAVRRGPLWMWFAFVAFLLSPRIYENHLWGFQSQFHFAWILCFLGISLLFRTCAGAYHVAGGIGCILLAAWSFSAALAASLAILAVYVLWQTFEWWGGSTSEGRGARPLVYATALAVPVLVSFGVWFALYEKPSYHPPMSSITDGEFWRFWLSLVSHGFGASADSILLGLACLALVVVPAIGALLVAGGIENRGAWAVSACSACMLAMLASIAIGRAEFGVSMSKDSRYAEYAGLLVPLAAASWTMWLRRGPAWGAALIALWLLTFAGHADEWRYREFYENYSQHFRAGYRCVEDYYLRGGDGDCPDVLDRPIGPHAEAARAAGMSFYRRMVDAKSE